MSWIGYGRAERPPTLLNVHPDVELLHCPDFPCPYLPFPFPPPPPSLTCTLIQLLSRSDSAFIPRYMFAMAPAVLNQVRSSSSPAANGTLRAITVAALSLGMLGRDRMATCCEGGGGEGRGERE